MNYSFHYSPVLKRITFSLLLLLGAASQAKPANAQALLPYTLPIDETRLQADGESLKRDAIQLAQFRQFDEALARAQLAAQLLPGDAGLLSLLGGLYMQVDDPQPEQAIVTLERAKALEPENPLVMFALGSAYFMQENYAESIRSIESGLNLEPDNPSALFDLGNAYYKLQQYDKAISQYEAAIENDDKFWPAVNNIGLVLYEAGDVQGAIAKWEEAITLAGEEQTEPQLAIAVAQYTQGNQNTTETEAVIAGLERDPRYAEIEFLEDNLWGEKLLTDTQQFFRLPALRDLLLQLQ